MKKIITFDGSKIFLINRNKSGQINIYVSKNEIGLKLGQIQETERINDLTANYLAKIELPNVQTYINLCRVLLSYATKTELVSIIGNPISWASYTIKDKTRSSKTNERTS